MFLTNDNYYSNDANKYYMSVSQYKSFLDCEARTVAELYGEYKRKPSDAMLVGSYVDAWCEGTLDEFKENHPEIYKRGKKENGLLEKFNVAEACIYTLNSDLNMMMYLEGEKQTILTADLFGVPWKIKMDNYNWKRDFISDLKVMASLTDKYYDVQNRRYINFVEHYKYNYQMCIYSEVERIAMGRADNVDTYLVVVTKQDPCDKAIFTGFNDDMYEVLDHVEFHLPRMAQLKNREIEPKYCGKCEYCRSIKSTEIMDYHNLSI